ncbi:MAG: DUF4231 domain-containing protein [Pseudomonadota bacterium]
MSATSHNPDGQLVKAWAAYRQSAATARSESGLLRSWRWRVLAVTVAGATAGALADALREAASTTPAWLVSGIGSAGSVLLAIATLITATLLTVSRQQRWTINRAVAEALKSECFRYATRTAPYDSADAAERLAARTQRLTEALGANAPSSTGPARTGGLPHHLAATDYLHRRVEDQQSWYADKAYAARNSLARFRLVSILLGTLAALLPVIGTLLDKPGPASWAALATTAGTAIGSFVYAERFAFLAESYAAAANRLDALRKRWDVSPQGDDDLQRLVDDVEQALSTENSAWMAELMREEE